MPIASQFSRSDVMIGASRAFPIGTVGVQPQTQSQPLRGLTVLAVEDSRFASEALRLMCQRSGARLRRAETLAAAQAHLRLYKPDVVIIDLGLPDGRGEALIRDLMLRPLRPRAVLGTSGDTSGRAMALAAGADGFLDKPLESLAAFQRVILRHLPNASADIDATDDPTLVPDLLALHDDLAHAAAVLAASPDAPARQYLAGFLTGVARHAHDAALEAAAGKAGEAPMDGAMEVLRGMIDRRLAQGSAAFSTQRREG